MRFYKRVVPGSVFLQIILCSNFGLFTSAFGWNSYRSLALDTKRKSASLHLHKGNAKEESYPSVPLKSTNSRRSFIDNALGSISVVAITSFSKISPAIAEEETGKTLRSNLYLILRVKEATFQETRLISSGKFKDVQRANVKLAVKFMVSNYRLADNFVAASSYLEGNRRIEAGNIGQSAVESLYTILEYFDSSDVQNIKVDSMSGKEALVLKGLDVTRSRIDDFLALFPPDLVESVKQQIREENDLNAKEFDPAIGVILNPSPVKT